MKVLVIGGAGYIGSHVVKALMSAGHKITVFDNLSSGLLQNLFPENEFVPGDTRNVADLERVFSRGFDAVVYLAALKAAGESMFVPEKYALNNISATINVLNACLKHNCMKFVFSSSAAIYGSPKYLPMDEGHEKNPENYYGFTKLEIEANLEWFSKLRGLRFAALRYFNAAGYDVDGFPCGLEQEPQNLIPRIMEVACGIKQELKVFGDDYDTPDGSCVRDYVHVSDLAKAHVDAIDYITKNDKDLQVNLGSETGISVLEVLEASRRITGKKIPAQITERRAGDPASLYATSKLARKTIDWNPKFSDLDTIVSSTWAVYKKLL
ncbi:MAG: UDP-glucose 4-epimerase GalE [Treponemataceae bacterium]